MSGPPRYKKRMAGVPRDRADTGHAVQEAARLDHRLLVLLLTHFAHMPNRRAKKVLDDSFANRIVMAHALGAIDDAARDDLVAINAVRNVFGHAKVREEARRFRG
jgi:hypothetical protein